MTYTARMPLDHFASLTSLQRSSLSGAAALLFYGGWAYLVNSMHGTAAAWKAACVQGSYSLVLTFVMALMIESLYRFVGRWTGNQGLRRWLTILLCCAAIFSSSWWINAMAGTPEIFGTVVLGYIVGGVYTIAYVYSIGRTPTLK